jgi:hypothetical protein
VGYLVKAARAPMVTMVKAVGKTPHKAVAEALFPVKVVKAVKLIRAALDSVSHVASLSPGSCKFVAHRELTTNLSFYLYLVSTHQRERVQVDGVLEVDEPTVCLFSK